MKLTGLTVVLTIFSAPALLAADPPKVLPAKVEGTARSITIPVLTHDLPSGVNHEVYLANCVSCHTSRYVSNQPAFPRKTWEAEVAKMVKSYGAPITDEDQKKIVEYLMVIKGKPDAVPVPPVPTPSLPTK